MAWPMIGPDFNEWAKNASGFACLIAQYPGFWTADFDLKYLDMRIDTRFDHFVLMDRDGKAIHPDRVLDAIDHMMNR